METPEGQTAETIFAWIKENKVLNMDLDTMYTRGTLMFLQFNNLMRKVSDLESKVVRISKQLENNAHMLREIKRSTALP